MSRKPVVEADDDQPPLNVQIVLLTQERQTYINTRFLLETRYRVNKRIGADPDVLAQISKELERNQGALTALNEELKALRKQAVPNIPMEESQ